MAILCPLCRAHSRVLNTRGAANGETIRLRMCPACAHRFQTVEMMKGTAAALRGLPDDDAGDAAQNVARTHAPELEDHLDTTPSDEDPLADVEMPPDYQS